MKKPNICSECGLIHEEKYYCDICGQDLILKQYGVPLTITFSYGDSLDGEEYHFCSKGHAIRFLANELRKENPRTDIEFGQQTEEK